MQFKKILAAIVLTTFLANCGTLPKTVEHSKKKKQTAYKNSSDQKSVDDLIYSELSRNHNTLLKKYTVPSTVSSLKGIKFDIPVTINGKVENWIDYFANGSGRKHYTRWLARSTRFVPTQLSILKEYGVPKDLIFLSMIESGFNTHAYSVAAASGLWQFIRSTGRLYGLESDYWTDERRDPEKATRAAAQHLKDLYEEFGDWYLAFAAYNAGSGKVRRAIAGTGSRDFWVLASSSYLRQETKDYVPKILAAAIVAKSPEKYGLKEIEYQYPIPIEKVTLSSPADLQTIADCAGIEMDMVRLLNPELIRNMTPLTSPNYVIKLPRGTGRVFETKFARLDRSNRLKNVRYIASGRETLQTIAQETGSSVSNILSVNSSIGGRGKIPEGTTLIVPQTFNSPPSINLRASAVGEHRLLDLISDNPVRVADKNSKKKKKEEKRKLPNQEEDSEIKVAWQDPNKGKSTSQSSELIEAKENSLLSSLPVVAATLDLPVPEQQTTSLNSDEDKSLVASNDTTPPLDNQIEQSIRKIGSSTEGKTVRVKSTGQETVSEKRTPLKGKMVPPKPVYYQVQKGDNLTEVADKFGVSLEQLREWNDLKPNTALFVNKQLRVQPPSRKEGTLVSAKNQKKTSAREKETEKTISHTVKKGETIQQIAKRYDVSPSAIIKTNGLSKKPIRPGIVLKIKKESVSRG